MKFIIISSHAVKHMRSSVPTENPLDPDNLGRVQHAENRCRYPLADRFLLPRGERIDELFIAPAAQQSCPFPSPHGAGIATFLQWLMAIDEGHPKPPNLRKRETQKDRNAKLPLHPVVVRIGEIRKERRLMEEKLKNRLFRHAIDVSLEVFREAKIGLHCFNPAAGAPSSAPPVSPIRTRSP